MEHATAAATTARHRYWRLDERVERRRRHRRPSGGGRTRSSPHVSKAGHDWVDHADYRLCRLGARRPPVSSIGSSGTRRRGWRRATRGWRRATRRRRTGRLAAREVAQQQATAADVVGGGDQCVALIERDSVVQRRSRWIEHTCDLNRAEVLERRRERASGRPGGQLVVNPMPLSAARDGREGRIGLRNGVAGHTRRYEHDRCDDNGNHAANNHADSGPIRLLHRYRVSPQIAMRERQRRRAQRAPPGRVSRASPRTCLATPRTPVDRSW
jgi:hypothetical protein